MSKIENRWMAKSGESKKDQISIHFVCDLEFKRRVERLAEKERRTPSSYARNALTVYMESQEREESKQRNEKL